MHSAPALLFGWGGDLEAFEEGQRVLKAKLARDRFTKTFDKHLLECGELGGVCHVLGHVGSVEVAAKCDDIFAAQLEPVLDVACGGVEGDQFGRRIFIGAIDQEAIAIVEAHDTAGVADNLELLVGEVAHVTADGARIGVACYEGALGKGGYLVKTFIVEMRDVEHHAAAFHFGNGLATKIGEARVGIVSTGKRARGVPCKGGHEHAGTFEGLDEVEVVREHARVLDRMDAGESTLIESGANVACGMHLGCFGMVEVRLSADVRHDLRMETQRLLGGEAIGDERGKALRPGSALGHVDRDGAVVVLEGEVALGAFGVVWGEEFVSRDGLEFAIDGLPAQAIGGIAM